MCHNSITGGSHKLHSWKPTWGRSPNEWGAKWLP